MLSKHFPLLNPSEPPSASAGEGPAPDQGALPVREEIMSVIKVELTSEPIDLLRLAEAIGKDPGLSAHLIARANSSFFGQRRTTDSITDAVLVLGLDATRLCVLSGTHLTNIRPQEEALTQPKPAKPGIGNWAAVFGRSKETPAFADTIATGFPHTIPLDRSRSKP